MSEFNSDTRNIEARNFRMQAFESLLREQFQLAYFGHIEYNASQDMSIMERHTLYRLLSDQKKEERQAKEDSIRKAKEKNKAHRWRHK